MTQCMTHLFEDTTVNKLFFLKLHWRVLYALHFLLVRLLLLKFYKEKKKDEDDAESLYIYEKVREKK